MSAPRLSVRARLSAAILASLIPCFSLRAYPKPRRYRGFGLGCEPLEGRLLLYDGWAPWYSVWGGAGTDPYYCNCDCGCNNDEMAGNNKTSGDGGRGAKSGNGIHPNEFPDIMTAHPPQPRLPSPPPMRSGGGGGSVTAGGIVVGGAEPILDGYSSNPVRYFDGLPDVDATDLISNGFGKPYGVTRSFALYLKTGPMGNHWDVDQLSYILHNPGGDYARPSNATDTFAVIESGGDTRYFDSIDNNREPTTIESPPTPPQASLA